MKKLNQVCWSLVFGLSLALVGQAFAASPAQVPKWDRFEATFESSVSYTNPLQEVKLEATFVSPKGEKTKVLGFWDGKNTWRVRFSPNETGEWTFNTTCTDVGNNGLHGQKGGFACTEAKGTTRFTKHGPIRVSPDGRSMVHEDGTAFFWLSDAAWNGALLSSPEEWTTYIKERTRQKFSAVEFVATQWRGLVEAGVKRELSTANLAYTGPSNRIVINPEFFQRMDQKIDALDNAGLLSVPAMLWADNEGENAQLNPGAALPEDQLILLGRYMVARWGANHVSWILAANGDFRGENAQKWKRIGAAIFENPHAPVTLLPANMQWAWNEFKDEAWFDFVSYQSGNGEDDQALRWLIQGPAAEDWMKLPHRPFINLAPAFENQQANPSKKPITPEMARRSIYWSLLVAPTAGVGYGSLGHWSVGEPAASWEKALQTPAAQQMTNLYNFFTSIDFSRLRPTPVFVFNQPGKEKPARYMVAARTDNKDLMVVYVPEDRTVEIKLDALPPSPNVTWMNPRTGESSPAVGVVTSDTCQFPTPSEGDWLLVMKSSK